MNLSPARYHHRISVRFADTDAQGHTFFGNYFTYMDEAFMAYLTELGYPWPTLVDRNLGIFYVDSGCQFKGPSFFGDHLHVHAAITHLGNSSLTAEMTMVRDHDRTVVAVGYIKGVLVDSRTERSTRIPDDLRRAVAVYQSA